MLGDVQDNVLAIIKHRAEHCASPLCQREAHQKAGAERDAHPVRGQRDAYPQTGRRLLRHIPYIVIVVENRQPADLVPLKIADEVMDILSQQFGIADQRGGAGIVTLLERVARLLLKPPRLIGEQAGVILC